MTLPVYPNTISIGDVCNQYGIPKTNVGLGTTLKQGGGYVAEPLRWGLPHGNITVIPSSGAVSLDNFHGAPIVAPSGSQYFYSSGTFYPPIGRSGVYVRYYDNNGWNTTYLSTSYGTSVAVTVNGSGSASAFGTITTAAFDRSVFIATGNVDIYYYPTTYIFNTYDIDTGLSPGGYSFTWNGQTYSTQMTTIPAGYDKSYVYYAASPGLIQYFADRYGLGLFQGTSETNHGERPHQISIHTVPNGALSGSGSFYLSYAYGRYATYLSANNSTGYVQIQQVDGYADEGYYYTVVNFQQPVWFYVYW
jgi:hypothetical protein